MSHRELKRKATKMKKHELNKIKRETDKARALCINYQIIKSLVASYDWLMLSIQESCFHIRVNRELPAATRTHAALEMRHKLTLFHLNYHDYGADWLKCACKNTLSRLIADICYHRYVLIWTSESIICWSDGCWADLTAAWENGTSLFFSVWTQTEKLHNRILV